MRWMGSGCGLLDTIHICLRKEVRKTAQINIINVICSKRTFTISAFSVLPRGTTTVLNQNVKLPYPTTQILAVRKCFTVHYIVPQYGRFRVRFHVGSLYIFK